MLMIQLSQCKDFKNLLIFYNFIQKMILTKALKTINWDQIK